MMYNGLHTQRSEGNYYNGISDISCKNICHIKALWRWKHEVFEVVDIILCLLTVFDYQKKLVKWERINSLKVIIVMDLWHLKRFLIFFSGQIAHFWAFVTNLSANYPRIDMLKFLTVGPPAFRLRGRSKVSKNWNAILNTYVHLFAKNEPNFDKDSI